VITMALVMLAALAFVAFIASVYIYDVPVGS
jgi:hypothetical protein